MDKEQIRSTVDEKLNAIYGLKNPSAGQVEKMVDEVFSSHPVLQFAGYRQLHPLFGCRQGRADLKRHYTQLYAEAEILKFQKQFIIVEGFSASAHHHAEIRFKESGSRYDFEIITLVDLDRDGRVRDLKLHFDTSTFLKAVHTPKASFKDVQAIMPHPKFDPNSKVDAGAVMSHLYDFFARLYVGQEKWEDLYALWAPDAEISFKSNVDLIPYAGRYANIEGVKQWFQNLLSTWSLATFNFTKVYAEGNIADFAMDEQHYYTNPDGSRRYLSVYLVQSWIVDDNKKVHLFQSHHDSAWMDNTMLATQLYKDYYGYPKDYPPKKKSKAKGNK
ncbi:MAG: nuclear transport factor 2 family protein [bacterium]